MQTASTRIWTRVTDFIFYDDNHYAKRVFINTYHWYRLLSYLKVKCNDVITVEHSQEMELIINDR